MFWIITTLGSLLNLADVRELCVDQIPAREPGFPRISRVVAVTGDQLSSELYTTHPLGTMVTEDEAITRAVAAFDTLHKKIAADKSCTVLDLTESPAPASTDPGQAPTPTGNKG